MKISRHLFNFRELWYFYLFIKVHRLKRTTTRKYVIAALFSSHIRFPPKMDELKPISHKQFNEFIKDSKGGTNDYVLKVLKAMLGFRPLKVRIVLVVS